LSASDGTVVRTIATGSGPLGVAFDGANVWVVNAGGNGIGTASKIRANDGVVLGTFSAPDGPYGIAFDGTYLWISGALYTMVMRASDGVLVGQWQIPPTVGVAFDGAHIWISNINQNTVTKF
jgi:DNA-binding beta-propeller fold protein YncE